MSIEIDNRTNDITIVDKSLYQHADNNEVAKLVINNKKDVYVNVATIVAHSFNASKTEIRTFIEILLLEKKLRELNYGVILKKYDIVETMLKKYDNNRVTYNRAIQRLASIGVLRPVGFKDREYTISDRYNINLIKDIHDTKFVLLEVK